MANLKQLLARRAPTLYRRLRGYYWRLQLEWRVVRHLNLATLASAIATRRSGLMKQLPLQSCRTLHIQAAEGIELISDMKDVLSKLNVRYSAGAHTVYISPEELAKSFLCGVAKTYPIGTGLKIVRQPGSYRAGTYLFGDSHSHLQRRLVHAHPQLQLVSGVLSIEALGPRLFDTLEIVMGSRTWVAYAVEHIPHESGSQSDSARCIAELRSLVNAGHIDVVVPNGFQHPDFQPPYYSGNIRWRDSGRAVYIDAQNFCLRDHTQYVRTLVKEAARESHFGDESLLLGGRYLYQSIPGHPGISKRSTDSRMGRIDKLLRDSNIALEDRLVLDVGCNIGMMMAEYLRRGAAWCHGWDQPRVIRHAERMLLGLGCTRFSLTGMKLTPSYRLPHDIPQFLAGKLSGCLVSYLAMYRHIGSLRSLNDIPWTALLIEGHEFDGLEHIKGVARDLCGTGDLRLLAHTVYTDGNSASRPIAVFSRAQ